jgi:type VI protein secretion system component VasF
LFQQRKHKTFNYQSRFANKDNVDSIQTEETNTKDYISKWKENRTSKRKVRAALPVKTLILFLVLLLICMYLLEKKYM